MHESEVSEIKVELVDIIVNVDCKSSLEIAKDLGCVPALGSSVIVGLDTNKSRLSGSKVELVDILVNADFN